MYLLLYSFWYTKVYKWQFWAKWGIGKQVKDNHQTVREFEAKSHENISDSVLFRTILGTFKHLLKHFLLASGWCLSHKNNKKITSFTYQMALIEFQIYSLGKIRHEICGEWKTGKTTQGLVFFCFFIKTSCFFSCRFFSINLKTPVFLISHRFLPITGHYFHHCILCTSEWLLLIKYSFR